MPFKRYRDLTFTVALIALPFFFLRANLKKPGSLNAMDRIFLRISAPIQDFGGTILSGISHSFSDYTYLLDIKKDNERLHYENARLRDAVRQLEIRYAENRELKRLLQLKDSLRTEAISARVVSTESSEFFRVTRLVLDRSSKLIRTDMPVVSADGVVGKVLFTEGDTVAVQLSVDAAFALDVEDTKTHARGFLRGTGDPSRYLCRMEMVDSRDEVTLGDLLVTSGKGKWFPKGIPVATVTKVNRQELGREQEVEAEPIVNFSKIETVLILATSESLEQNPSR